MKHTTDYNDDYGTELVNFGNHFDMDAEAFEHFENCIKVNMRRWRLCRIHLSELSYIRDLPWVSS